ncbi:MAG: LysR family transcriptional regulator [Burkholderiaceae bacterium]
MTGHVTLRQLRALSAVVEHASFTEAARAMHLSQGALSGLVKELESQLGVRLLDRNTRRVSASVVGEAFVPLVRRVIHDLDEALESLDNLKALRRGVVRVAAPETLSCTLMPELIASYSAAHPAIEIRFQDVPIEQVEEGLASGSIDIGFGPETSIAEDGLSRHVLWTDSLCVALHRDDPLARHDTVAWRDLKATPVFTYMRAFRSRVLDQVPKRRQPTQIIPVNRVNTALSMLSVRRGAVICPSMTRSLVEGFGLTLRPLNQPVVERSIALFLRDRPSPSPAVASFAEFARRYADDWQRSPPQRGGRA